MLFLAFLNVLHSLYMFCDINAQLGVFTSLCAGTLFVMPCYLPGALLLEPAGMLSCVGLRGPFPRYLALIGARELGS